MKAITSFALGAALHLIVPDAAAADLPAPWPAEAKLNNPWPAEWEREYEQRARHVLDVWKTKKPGGTTYGESEKALYPLAMFAFLNGQTNQALKSLQEEDNQAKSDHAHTLGLDFYWCFTLKGQVRKYFYFGRWLDPAYKQRMFDAAKIWTEQEPLHRPHPRFGKGFGGKNQFRHRALNVSAVADMFKRIVEETWAGALTQIK